jgi:hypothetical protein
MFSSGCIIHSILGDDDDDERKKGFSPLRPRPSLSLSQVIFIENFLVLNFMFCLLLFIQINQLFYF